MPLKGPPESLDAAGKQAWLDQEQRKMFLGRFASRNLQRQLEEVTTTEERALMPFKTLCEKLRERFRLNSNTTVANFKFRKITQKQGETFEKFVIRIRDSAAVCNFQCTKAQCNVLETMMRNQLIFGTSSAKTRKQALHEQWNLKDMISKVRSLEAARKGLNITCFAFSEKDHLQGAEVCKKKSVRKKKPSKSKRCLKENTDSSGAPARVKRRAAKVTLKIATIIKAPDEFQPEGGNATSQPAGGLAGTTKKSNEKW